MIHGVGGSFCCSELRRGQATGIVTGRLTNGAEEGLQRGANDGEELVPFRQRREELQGVAEGGSECATRPLKVHESAEEENRSRSERRGGREWKTER